MRLFVISVGIAVISGCSSTATKPPDLATYRCEDGRQFELGVALAGDAAIISISGMRFQLLREPATNGTRFGCGVLTVWRNGDVTEVQMDDAQVFKNCRPLLP